MQLFTVLVPCYWRSLKNEQSFSTIAQCFQVETSLHQVRRVRGRKILLPTYLPGNKMLMYQARKRIGRKSRIMKSSEQQQRHEAYHDVGATRTLSTQEGPPNKARKQIP